MNTPFKKDKKTEITDLKESQATLESNKTECIANMSHDIQTPLKGIIQNTSADTRSTTMSIEPLTRTDNSTNSLNTPMLLLVEDNTTALMILETLVTTAGLNFMHAPDGLEGLALAKSYSFDLIITDIGLPGLSGIHLTEMLRSYEKQKGKKPTPIIGLTAHGEEKIKQECLQAGMNEAYTKPMAPCTLEEIKSRYLKSQSSSVDIVNATSLNSSGMCKEGLPDGQEALFQLDLLPLFDIDEALTVLGNDENMLNKIVTSMIENDNPEAIHALEIAHAAADWCTIEKLAFRMKGGFMYCGTLRLVYACQYLERYLKTGQTKLLEPLYQQLLKVLADTTVEVNEWLLR